MIAPLTDAQRNLLYKLVLQGQPLSLDVAKAALRRPLEAQGLVELIPHPTKKRAKACVATETGWAWVVDRFHEPIRSASVQLRDPWNALVDKLMRYLEKNDTSLAMVLNVDHERIGAPTDTEDPAAALKVAYASITGGAMKKRVLIADLRERAQPQLATAAFDRVLHQLIEDEKVAVFPEDDRAALRPADHEGAFRLSGVPMHVIYWEH